MHEKGDFMKLNQATDYAFRMVLHMALLPSGSKITGAVLAEHELIPERFCSRLCVVSLQQEL